MLFNVGSVSAYDEITVCESGCDYAKIQYAIDSASSGDTILVKDGTYIEDVNVYKHHLTIKSENGADGTIVKQKNQDDSVFEVTADYVEISGFTVVKVNNGDSDYGGINIKSNSNIITNNVLSGFFGIYLDSSDNNLINNNKAYNEYGFMLHYSNNNSITNNSVSGYVGIILYSSSNNMLNNNTALAEEGIRLRHSDNNALINNNASFCVYGITLYLSSNNSITGNTANNNQVKGVSLSNSNNNSITGNNASNNLESGISLSDSNDNNIIGNTANSNWEVGIYITDSNHTTIRSNVFEDNIYGIYFITSEYNKIYLNNFINNYDNVASDSSTNTWNSSEPITYIYNGKVFTNYTGNYWGDYTDDDENNDGIWDNPYTIDSNNQDNYSLAVSFEKINVYESGTIGFVIGTVDYNAGNGIVDADVTVKCNPDTPYELTADTITYEGGCYAAWLNCDEHSPVTVTATKYGTSGESSGIMEKYGFIWYITMTNIDVTIPIKVLDEVPYIRQVGDTSDDFDGRCACGATSAVMIAAYYDRLPLDPMNCSECQPNHTTDYGRYVSENYTLYGHTFDTSHPTLDGTGYGAYGHIHNYCSDGSIGCAWANKAVNYFRKHGLFVKFDKPPTEIEVQAEIDKGHPVWASTKLWAAGHIVVIKGYNDTGYYVADPWPYDGTFTNDCDDGSNMFYTWEEMQVEKKHIVTTNPISSGDVVNVLDDEIYVREEPRVNAPDDGYVGPTGTRGILLYDEDYGRCWHNGPDGYTWWKVRWENGKTGWSASGPVWNEENWIEKAADAADVGDIKVKIKCPSELRVYDSQYRVTGLVNGTVKEEIPFSTYDSENKTVVVLYLFDTYYYEIAGTDTGTYGLEITSKECGESVTFALTNVSTTNQTTHEYTINWEDFNTSAALPVTKLTYENSTLIEVTYMGNNEENITGAPIIWDLSVTNTSSYIPFNIIFTYNDTIVSRHASEGAMQEEFIDALKYDISLSSLQNTLKINLDDINLTHTSNKTIGLEKTKNQTEIIYVINLNLSEWNQTNVTINLSYDEFSINYITLYKCTNWNFTERNCTDENWTELTYDEQNGFLALNVSSFSGFKIEQEPHCGDNLCNNEETCATCPQDCGPCIDTTVYGIVYGSTGSLAQYIDVTVTCNPEMPDELTIHTTTDDVGVYLVDMTTDCADGSPLLITAQEDDEYGQTTGIMDYYGVNMYSVTLSETDVPVPEFPMAVIPVLLSVLSFGLIRKMPFQ